MKNKKIEDERVLAQRRKIGNDAFQILFFGLLLSVLIQQYIFDAPFSQYAVEMILFMVSSVYLLFRSLISGDDIMSYKKYGQKIVILNSLVCGITITIINTTFNYMRYKDFFSKDIANTILVSVVTLVSATITAFIAFEILYILNKKKQLKIEAQLKSQEDDVE